MSNLKRQKPPTFDVIPDSSVVFSDRPKDLVSGGFEKLWHELSKFANLQLLIPSVVLGERMFQLMCVARESLENARKSHETIGAIWGNELPALPSEAEIRDGIKKRFQLWCKKTGAKILPMPTEKVDWNNIIEAAIWRTPPFSHAGNPKTEKGFRDCLVLETLSDFGNANSDKNIVFLSMDTLLRETAANRFGQKESRLTYNNLEAFGSYLKLIDEKLTNEFVALLLKKIDQVFYDESDRDSVYFKCKIAEKIQNQFAARLNSPQAGQALGLSAALLLNPATNVTEWKIASDQKYFVFQTEFVKLEKNDRFYWKTQVELVQLFTTGEESERSYFDERVRKSTFDVLWVSTVSDDATFSDLQLVGIDEARQTFELPTIEEKKEYGFKLHPIDHLIEQKRIRPSLQQMSIHPFRQM